MKYLFLIIVLLSCKSEPTKVIVHNPENDTTSHASVKHDAASIDKHDHYETSRDTALLNAVMERIFKFPEVEATNRQISNTSKGAHGVSIMVHEEFEGDTAYYDFMVGDNSRKDRYVNIFNFLLDKRTGEIKAYDPLLDSIMSLQDWRKTRK